MGNRNRVLGYYGIRVLGFTGLHPSLYNTTATYTTTTMYTTTTYIMSWSR